MPRRDVGGRTASWRWEVGGRGRRSGAEMLVRKLRREVGSRGGRSEVEEGGRRTRWYVEEDVEVELEAENRWRLC
jgi:hypothetical protein